MSLNLFQGGNIIRVLRRKMFIIFRISHELLKYQLLNSLNYKDVLFLKTCVQYLSSMGTFRTALLVTVFLLLINIFSGVVNDTPNTNNGGNEQEMILLKFYCQTRRRTNDFWVKKKKGFEEINLWIFSFFLFFFSYIFMSI